LDKMKSLGHILKKSRESIGLSINQASEKTKIRPHLIEAFEKDDFAILPGVYAKSFIKTYAEFLNISYAEIEDQVNELFKPVKPVVEIENPALNETRELVISGKPISKTHAFKKYLTDDSGTNLVNYLVYIGLTLAFIVLIYFTFFNTDSAPLPPDPTEIQSGSAADTDDALVIEQKDGGLLSAFYSQPDSLILEASAQDTAWIKIDIDGKRPEVILMTPGMYKRWAAEEYCLVTLGNAAAVQFKRNGIDIPPLGSKGSVVRNIKITKDEILNAAAFDPNAKKRKSRKKKAKKRPRTLNLSPIENTLESERKNRKKK
jgi:hypothetical protein